MKKTYNVPAEFQPISMWGYFCVLILVLLIFGIITLIGFLTGGANAILQWFQSIGK